MTLSLMSIEQLAHRECIGRAVLTSHDSARGNTLCIHNVTYTPGV